MFSMKKEEEHTLYQSIVIGMSFCTPAGLVTGFLCGYVVLGLAAGNAAGLIAGLIIKTLR